MSENSQNWIDERTPGHEGQLIGLIPAEPSRDRFGDGYRELRAADVRYAGFYPHQVQIGCTCGWRSSRLEAPIDLLWRPEGWTLSTWFAADCLRIWRTHARVTVYDTLSPEERDRLAAAIDAGVL